MLEYDTNRLRDCIKYVSSIQDMIKGKVISQLSALKVPENDEEGKIDFSDINSAAASLASETGRVCEALEVLVENFEQVENTNGDLLSNVGSSILGDQKSLKEKNELYMSNLKQYEAGESSTGSINFDDPLNVDIENKLSEINEKYDKSTPLKIANGGVEIEMNKYDMIQPTSLVNTMFSSFANVLGGAVIDVATTLETAVKNNMFGEGVADIYNGAISMANVLNALKGGNGESGETTEENQKKYMENIENAEKNLIIASIPPVNAIYNAVNKAYNIVSAISNGDKQAFWNETVGTYKSETVLSNKVEEMVNKAEDSVADHFGETAADMKKYRFVQELAGAFLVGATWNAAEEAVEKAAAETVGKNAATVMEKNAEKTVEKAVAAAKKTDPLEVAAKNAFGDDANKSVSELWEILEKEAKSNNVKNAADAATTAKNLTVEKAKWLDELSKKILDADSLEDGLKNLTPKERSMLSDDNILRLLKSEADGKNLKNAAKAVTNAAEDAGESYYDDVMKILDPGENTTKIKSATEAVTSAAEDASGSYYDDVMKILDPEGTTKKLKNAADAATPKKLTAEEAKWLDDLSKKVLDAESSGDILKNLTPKEKEILSDKNLLQLLELEANAKNVKNAAETVTKAAEEASGSYYDDVMKILDPEGTTKNIKNAADAATTKKLTAEEAKWLDDLSKKVLDAESSGDILKNLTPKEKSMLSDDNLLRLLEYEAKAKNIKSSAEMLSEAAEKEVAKMAGKNAKSVATNKVSTLFENGILGKGKEAGSKLMNSVSDLADDAGNAAKKLGNSLKNLAGDALESGKNVIGKVKNGISVADNLVSPKITQSVKNVTKAAAAAGTVGIVIGGETIKNNHPENTSDVVDVEIPENVEIFEGVVGGSSEETTKENDKNIKDVNIPSDEESAENNIQDKKEVKEEEKFDENIFNADEIWKNEEIRGALDMYGIEYTDVVGNEVNRNQDGMVDSIRLKNGLIITEDGSVMYKQDGETYDFTSEMQLLKDAFQSGDFNISDINDISNITAEKFEGNRYSFENGASLEIVNFTKNGTWMVKGLDENGDTKYGYYIDDATGGLLTGYKDNVPSGNYTDDGVYGYYANGERVYADYGQANGDWKTLKNIALGYDSGNFKTIGCGTTAVCDILYGLGHDITPETAFSSPASGGSLRGEVHDYGHDTKDLMNYGNLADNIVDELSEGHPVVYYMPAGNQWGQHIVAMVDYDKETDAVVLLDPGSRLTSRTLSVSNLRNMGCVDAFSVIP